MTTDQGGVAVIRIKAGAQPEKLDMEATDKEGNHASTSLQLAVRDGSDQILLRTERAVYKAGDRMQLRVLSTKERGSAYVDVVKDGQTVLTRDLDIEHGQAELALTATPDLAGTLDFNAYLFGAGAIPIGDHRLVFVQPADELKIDATSDAPVYKPGNEARVRFRVTNSKGEGVQAALGLQVVDEAVFALAEKQPGFAKVFFYLEQEVMKPRFEIHSIGMPDIVEPVPLTRFEQRDRAARALFSATEMVSNNKFETEIGRTVSQVKYGDYASRYRARFHEQANQLAATLSRTYKGGDLTEAMAKTAPHDAWDTGLRLERAPWNSQYYTLRSAGPDKTFNNADDLTSFLLVRTEKVYGPPTSGGVNLKIDHDRGPFNGRAEIAGSVTDQMGGPVGGATITARELSAGTTRTARSHASGQFNLSALPAGDYEIHVSAAGFQLASQKLSLQVRDRALLSATLNIGAVTETVMVMNGAVGDGIGRGAGGGVGGGAFRMGGVMGGMVAGLPAAVPAPPLQKDFFQAANVTMAASSGTLDKK